MKKEYKYSYIKLKDVKGVREENIYIVALINGIVIGVVIMFIVMCGLYSFRESTHGIAL